ncbi:MAG: poly(A) polymerase I [Gammaproteobacteria bacterium]|nr:MAG: poly(A) polymerase I [Gammaproteobacteria bacterium]
MVFDDPPMRATPPTEPGTDAVRPRIVPRSEHNISRANISENALKVLYRLHKAGFAAHLVGGCVRDLLLGRQPKDFDVVTDAHPEQIKRLFSNCRLIGRRFRLAHVVFGRNVVEVATFRGSAADAEGDEHLRRADGMILRDNVYGTIDEDVWRRDFTVNALYYDIADFSLIDYVGGLDDLRAGLIRPIGEPERRYREDPVRMLRAVRFAAKLDFRIVPEAAEPILRLGHLLREVPPARLFDEVVKLFHGGAALAALRGLIEFDLLRHLFPLAAAALEGGRYAFARPLFEAVAASTDARIAADKSVTPAFLYAAFLWPALLEAAGYEGGEAPYPSGGELQKVAGAVIARQTGATAVPRRFVAVVREIWSLQPRLQRNVNTRRALALLEHPRFRAAYDLLCLRAAAGEPVQAEADWWTELQALPPERRLEKLAEAPARKRRRRRVRKRARRARSGADGA